MNKAHKLRSHNMLSKMEDSTIRPYITQIFVHNPHLQPNATYAHPALRGPPSTRVTT